MVSADASDDSAANRAYGAEKGIAVVIPNRPNRVKPVPLDEESYQLTAPVPAEKIAAAVQALTEVRRSFPVGEDPGDRRGRPWHTSS